MTTLMIILIWYLIGSISMAIGLIRYNWELRECIFPVIAGGLLGPIMLYLLIRDW